MVVMVMVDMVAMVDMLAVSVVDVSGCQLYGFYIGGYPLVSVYSFRHEDENMYIFAAVKLSVFHTDCSFWREEGVVMEMEQCGKVCNCQLLIRRLAPHELLAILQNTFPLSTSASVCNVITERHVFPAPSAEQNIEIKAVNGFNTLAILKTLVVAK